MEGGGAVAGETITGTAHRMPAEQSSALTKTRLAAGVSLGIFMLALESERLSALMHVGESSGIAPFQTSLVALALFIVGVAFVCLRPPHAPAPAAAISVVAIVCSLSVASLFFLQYDPALFPIQFLGDLAFSLSPPLLLYFWLQRCTLFGKSFVIEGFGIGAVTLGCLSMLTIVLEHRAALVLVALLPLAGAALLCTVKPAHTPINTDAPAGNDSRENRDGLRNGARWNALKAVGGLTHRTLEDAADLSLGKLAFNAFVRLVPFFCYALLFGSVHFSWLAHQDEASVGLWVQLGAGVGTTLCGLAALALSHIRWGRALENITHLLLTAFAIVALWLSTFLASNYVFAYLVLLNIAQKLTFMLMLVFGFPFARDSSQRVSLWAVAYLSFFAGTCVSSFLGATCTTAMLNIACAAALAVLLLADVAGIASLYGVSPAGEAHTAPDLQGIDTAGAFCRHAGAGASAPEASHPSTSELQAGASPCEAVPVRTAEGKAIAAVAEEGPGIQQASSVLDRLPYTCHLIAVEYDLTRREEEILQLLVRGRTAARIAETLCITTATTRTHLRNIYAKLGVHSQQDILDMYEDFASRR